MVRYSTVCKEDARFGIVRATKKKAGYEYLTAYKLTVPIYDYTVEFCKRWIPKSSRTYDQMEKGARSGTQNVLEGYMQQSLKIYIRLAGVSRGSLEELLKDYKAFGRQRKYEIWTPERCRREIREIGEIWEIIHATPTLPDNPNFPDLPNNLKVAMNMLITLINQANYHIDKLVESLNEKHRKEGGFTENLYKRRKKYRGY